jgi:hypothetical protein
MSRTHGGTCLLENYTFLTQCGGGGKANVYAHPKGQILIGFSKQRQLAQPASKNENGFELEVHQCVGGESGIRLSTISASPYVY